MIPRNDITAVILAGGRGMRMGGVDKGLQTFRGAPLAMQVMFRIAPQVDSVMINANRNLSAYEAFGVPVWPDALPDHPGPLAGFLTGLEHCPTPYLLTVPCDTPNLPEDLAPRLAAALSEAQADVAMPVLVAGGTRRTQPVFCLMQIDLMEDLASFVKGGGRKIDQWTARLRCVEVPFDDETAFFNLNTAEELRTGVPSADER